MSLISDDQRNASARRTAKENARHYFEQDISYSQKDHQVKIQIKRKTYIHLSLATSLLDCVSTAVRTQAKVIPLSDMKEAEKHLNLIQHDRGDSVPAGTGIDTALKNMMGSVSSSRISVTCKGES